MPTPGDIALAGTFGGGPGSAPGERRCNRCEDEFILLYSRSMVAKVVLYDGRRSVADSSAAGRRRSVAPPVMRPSMSMDRSRMQEVEPRERRDPLPTHLADVADVQQKSAIGDPGSGGLMRLKSSERSGESDVEPNKVLRRGP